MAILLLGLRDVRRSAPDVATCAVPQLVPLGCAILLAITARAFRSAIHVLRESHDDQL
jgi:hypothetical protein